MSMVPFIRCARRLRLMRPWPLLSSEVSKPTPLSAITRTSCERCTSNSISIREHPEWRAALLAASLKVSSTSRRTSAPSFACSSVAGAENRTSMPRSLNRSSVYRRAPTGVSTLKLVLIPEDLAGAKSNRDEVDGYGIQPAASMPGESSRPAALRPALSTPYRVSRPPS